MGSVAEVSAHREAQPSEFRPPSVADLSPLEPSGVAEPGGISDRRRQVIRASTATSAADATSAMDATSATNAWCTASRRHAALQTLTETVDPARSCKQENRIFVFTGLLRTLRHSTSQDHVNKTIFCVYRVSPQTETLDPTRSCKQEDY